MDSNFTRGEAVETNEIINRLNTIFREVFDDDTINVNPKMVYRIDGFELSGSEKLLCGI